MNQRSTSPLAVVLLIASLSAAHADGENSDSHNHGHDHGKEASDHGGKAADHANGPSHGGQFVLFDGHHGIEMVASDDAVVFHLTEDRKPMDVTGGTFRAVVQTKAGITVLPVELYGSRLSAKLKAPLTKGAKVVVSGKDAHGHAIQARFVKD